MTENPKLRPDPTLRDGVRAHVITFYETYKQDYAKIWSRLDETRENWARADFPERVALLKMSYVLSVLSVRADWEAAKDVFLEIMSGENVVDAWGNLGLKKQKRAYMITQLAYGHEDFVQTVQLLEDGKVDAAHQNMLDNISYVGDAKAPFTLANLGFTQKMCLDANVVRLLATKAPKQLKQEEYDEVCGEVEDLFPDLAKQMDSYHLQWLLFDYQRFYRDFTKANRGGAGAFVNTRSPAASHEEYFQFSTGDPAYVERRMDELEAWCAENEHLYGKERAWRNVDTTAHGGDPEHAIDGKRATFDLPGGVTTEVGRAVDGAVAAEDTRHAVEQAVNALGTGPGTEARVEAAEPSRWESTQEYMVVLPKFDNSGNKIDPQVHDDMNHALSERFGGTTRYPSTEGCWVNEDTGELQCEENTVITTMRMDDEAGPREDMEWIRQQAEELADDLGQWAITVQATDTQGHFAMGEWRESARDDYLA